MASINLYKIDLNKVQLCLQDLAASRLALKNTLEFIKIIDGVEYNFGATLYLEGPYQGDDGISWNWLLNEFQEPTYQVIRAPKAVLLIEEIVGTVEVTYAITFGSSYFRIDKFCDKDFGFKFASRMEYTNVKTTTLTAPNLNRSKTVNTYINYSELDFNSGESFSKLKVNAKIGEDFTIFKAAIEIGNSIRFNIDNETIEGILEVILYVEEILRISDENVRYKIPLFQLVKDDAMLVTLNQNFNQTLSEALLGERDMQLFSLPELEIIGANEIFNHTDDDFELKYPRADSKKITHLTIETIRSFCQENTIDSVENIYKIRLIRYREGVSVVTLQLMSIVEYTDDENKCIFSGGKWYLFNNDYLTYLNDSVKEIKAMYNVEYDFNDTIHNQFVDSKYEVEKDEGKYVGKTVNNIKEALKRKYYAERCFNLLREQEGSFSNYDRVGTTAGFEKMDLYETDTATMFAVKKGKSSSDLCYAVDQSLTALKKYKHGEIPDMPPINNVGLWFILERAGHLLTDAQNEVDLSSLDMLMLKNRIDQWKKEVRLAGYKPIIYINYRA